MFQFEFGCIKVKGFFCFACLIVIWFWLYVVSFYHLVFRCNLLDCLLDLCFPLVQNAMPLSAGLLRSQRCNATPHCPPRIQVQQLKLTSWTRLPSQTVKVMVDQPDAYRGWTVQCSQALQVMNLQIPDEDR